MAAPARPRRWRDSIAVYRDRRMAFIFFLGMASGLPSSLVFATLSIWLREEGLSRTAIGLLGIVATPYAINFLWAPLVDRLRLPALGALGQHRHDPRRERPTHDVAVPEVPLAVHRLHREVVLEDVPGTARLGGEELRPSGDLANVGVPRHEPPVIRSIPMDGIFTAELRERRIALCDACMERGHHVVGRSHRDSWTG